MAAVRADFFFGISLRGEERGERRENFSLSFVAAALTSHQNGLSLGAVLSSVLYLINTIQGYILCLLGRLFYSSTPLICCYTPPACLMSLTDDEPTDEIFFEFTTGPCDVCTFATLVFSQRWTEQFLANELLDIDISVGHWEVDTIAHLPSSQQGISSQPVHPEKPTSLRRVARSFHPSAVSFPGLATHAENIKEQHLRLHKNRQKLTMRECTTLNGIPMSDYFVINMVWIIENVPSPYSRENLNSMKGSACNTVCRVRIYIEIDFKKSTWFQGTIISNTKAELLSVCEKWRDSVIRDVLDRPFVNDELSAVFKDRKLDSGNTAASGVPAVGGNSVQYSDPVCMLWGEDGIKSEQGAVLPAAPAHPRSRTSSEANMTYSMSSDGSVERGVYVDTDEDMDDDAIFYDCQSDIPESMDIESNERGHLLTKIDSNKPLSDSAVNTSYRDTVINFVDICFILFEFMYWKLHFFYQNDMRYFFDVASTSDIAARAFGSVIPGYHDRVLSQPDLYGPLMCVFCLPQVVACIYVYNSVYVLY